MVEALEVTRTTSDDGTGVEVEGDWASRSDLQRTRKQLRETRLQLNEMTTYLERKVADLTEMHSITIGLMAKSEKSMIEKLSQRIQDVSDMAASTAAVQVFMDKVENMECRIRSLDDWAGGIAGRANPDALWFTLSERDNTTKEMEARIAALESEGSLRMNPNGPEDIHAMVEGKVNMAMLDVWAKLQELEDWIGEWSQWPTTEGQGGKKASDHKMVQNLKPLVDDKSKFRQWNLKFTNALTDYNKLYGKALTSLMWADTEALP